MKRDKARFLSMLLAMLVLATAVPGFFVPVKAGEVEKIIIEVTDGNDDVFFPNETITMRWKQNVKPNTGPAVGVYYYNDTNYRLLKEGNDVNIEDAVLIMTEIIEGITYYTYEANITIYNVINPNMPYHIYIDAMGKDLPSTLDLVTRDYDLYVHRISSLSVISLATNQFVGGTINLLK